MFFFFFSSRRRHTRSLRDWSSDVCSSDLALARQLRHLECGAGGRRSDVDELVAHLAIDRKLRANVGEKGVELDDVFHFAADALDGSFQIFVDQRRLLAEIRALLAGAVISELSRDIDRTSGAIHLDDMAVA